MQFGHDLSDIFFVLNVICNVINFRYLITILKLLLNMVLKWCNEIIFHSIIFFKISKHGDTQIRQHPQKNWILSEFLFLCASIIMSEGIYNFSRPKNPYWSVHERSSYYHSSATWSTAMLYFFSKDKNISHAYDCYPKHALKTLQLYFCTK